MTAPDGMPLTISVGPDDTLPPGLTFVPYGAVIPQQAQRVITVTGEPDGLPAAIEDPGAAHQIRIVTRFRSGNGRCTEFVVTCTCLGPRRGPGAGRVHASQGIIMARPAPVPVAEAVAAWADWHQGKQAP